MPETGPLQPVATLVPIRPRVGCSGTYRGSDRYAQGWTTRSEAMTQA
jgi:hypothetical protein